MAKLILIKHAKPVVEAGKLPEEWGLSQEGRQACEPLAEAIRPFAPAVLVSSTETKASETAEELAKLLSIPSSAAKGLEEHDRSDVPQMRAGEFISHMELLFRRPGELVLGKETAEEALGRFESALADVVAEHPGETLAIVTHGTVLALFLAAHNPPRRGFELWRQMGNPSAAVVMLPDYKLERLIERV